MASYDITYNYALSQSTTSSYTVGPGSGLPPQAGTFAMGDKDPSSDSFTLGERLYFFLNGEEINQETLATFAGYSDGNLIVETYSGQYGLLGNQVFTPGTIIQATEGSLVVCFLTGTRIATPDGPRAVEELAAGDLVLTAEGTAEPVRWMGRQSVVTLFADPARSYPIRIQAGALGQGLPERDLFLSPDHALLVDGLLVQAAALVNGGSIHRVERPEPRFTYHHVELASHALILAEGVAAETFVDNATRARFDNYAEYLALPPAPPTGELPMPRVKSARQLPAALRQRFAA